MNVTVRIGSALSAILGLVLILQTGCQSEKGPAKSAGKQSKAAAAGTEQPAGKTGQPSAVKADAAAAAQPTEQLPKIPKGLQAVAMVIPEDNPMTPEKVELGKMLYFDTRLSKSGKICATCHDPKMAWAEHEPTSKGIDDQVGGRNSPTVINAAYAPTQFWDGRAKTLEEQALGPIENPIEMGHKLPAMIADLSKVQAYQDQFKKVFGTDVTAEGIAKAIAAFERTVLSGNSPYDQYKDGDEKALTEPQKRGMELFDKHCSGCHEAPLFSNYEYYNAGVGMKKEKLDAGRKDVTKKDSDMGKFRVPALREVAKTAPYFHDGGTAKLEDAVALMASGGQDNPHLSPFFKALRGAKITAEQQKDLVEFLKALSGEFPVMEAPKLP